LQACAARPQRRAQGKIGAELICGKVSVASHKLVERSFFPCSALL